MNQIERRMAFDFFFTWAMAGVVLALIVLSPFPAPMNRILASVIAVAAIGWGFSSHLRTRDEVASATWTFSAATGAAVGLPVAMALAVLVRWTPSLAEFVADTLGTSDNPAVVGFVFGTAVTIFLFAVAASITGIARTNRLRRR